MEDSPRLMGLRNERPRKNDRANYSEKGGVLCRLGIPSQGKRISVFWRSGGTVKSVRGCAVRGLGISEKQRRRRKEIP